MVKMLDGLEKRLLDIIEDYGKYKGVLMVDKNGYDNWVPVGEVKRLIRAEINAEIQKQKWEDEYETIRNLEENK